MAFFPFFSFFLEKKKIGMDGDYGKDKCASGSVVAFSIIVW